MPSGVTAEVSGCPQHVDFVVRLWHDVLGRHQAILCAFHEPLRGSEQAAIRKHPQNMAAANLRIFILQSSRSSHLRGWQPRHRSHKDARAMVAAAGRRKVIHLSLRRQQEGKVPGHGNVGDNPRNEGGLTGSHGQVWR